MSQLDRALRRARTHASRPLRNAAFVPAWTFDGEDVAPQGDLSNSTPGIAPARVDAAVVREPANDAESCGHQLTLSVDSADKLVIGPRVQAEIRDQFRKIAASLYRLQERDRVRSVMIASAVPSEGKTLTAINVALTLSESYGCRVLLIDADLRRPSVHRVLGLPNRTGLRDCGPETDGKPLPVRHVLERFSVLTAGKSTNATIDPLVSGPLQTALEFARREFDWVVVDTPPAELLPDAKIVAGLVDTVVIVVHAGSTGARLIQRAVEAIGRDRIAGVVLNQARTTVDQYPYSYYADRYAENGDTA